MSSRGGPAEPQHGLSPTGLTCTELDDRLPKRLFVGTGSGGKNVPTAVFRPQRWILERWTYLFFHLEHEIQFISGSW